MGCSRSKMEKENDRNSKKIAENPIKSSIKDIPSKQIEKNEKKINPNIEKETTEKEKQKKTPKEREKNKEATVKEKERIKEIDKEKIIITESDKEKITETDKKEKVLLTNKETDKEKEKVTVRTSHKTNTVIKIETKNMVGENNDATFFENYSNRTLIKSSPFGKVYKVYHMPTGTYRTLKVVKKRSAKILDGEDTFLTEIKILQILDHPNILKLYEHYSDQNYYYIITEFIEGGEMCEQIYKFQYYNEYDAARLMQQIFSCVSYMHMNNIVHRDLKLDYIILESLNPGDLSIKIVDFGTATFIPENNIMTRKIGTPYYIAPEVLDGKYGKECDLWSCGVIMFVLIAGYPPFDGDNNNEILENVRKGVCEFDTKEWRLVSKEGKDLIRKLLEKDPHKRISAQDALNDPWIISHTNLTKIKEGAVEKLTLSDGLYSFSKKHKLQQASIAYIVHQMSNNEMVRELRDIFKKIDISGEGLISKEELKRGYKKFFNDRLSDQDFNDLVSNIDQDNSGQISLEEFLRATLKYENIITEKNLEMAFNFFDKDKSGKLSADEIKTVLGLSEDDEETAEIVKEMLDEVDENGDGQISFEEFREMMKRSVTIKDKN